MRARYWLATDIAENEGRRKTEVLTWETGPLVCRECREATLGHREGGRDYRAQGGRLSVVHKCTCVCATWGSVSFFFYKQQGK